MNLKTMMAGTLALAMLGCSKTEDFDKKATDAELARKPGGGGGGSSISLGIVGDAADVSTPTTGGTLLMGGSTDVDNAMKWMITKAGGGDIVVIRASGTNAYNSYIYGLGTCNSVETLLIDSRTDANSTEAETKIRNAEAVFIAGGDQWNYVNYWKDTKVEDALNYLRNTKGCVIGGTSAGCAIQGNYYFTAQNGTVYSDEMLANPYNQYATIGVGGFLNNPYLGNLITDTHFNNPDRKGRLLGFLARMSKDNGIVPKGVGVEERTAVCIDADGSSKVFGNNSAYFMIGENGVPETCVSGSKLTWNRSAQAVKVYKVPGTTGGTNTFNFSSWSGTGGTSQFYYADNGTLKFN